MLLFLSQLGKAYTLVGQYEKAWDYLEDGLRIKKNELEGHQNSKII